MLNGGHFEFMQIRHCSKAFDFLKLVICYYMIQILSIIVFSDPKYIGIDTEIIFIRVLDPKIQAKQCWMVAILNMQIRHCSTASIFLYFWYVILVTIIVQCWKNRFCCNLFRVISYLDWTKSIMSVVYRTVNSIIHFFI